MLICLEPHLFYQTKNKKNPISSTQPLLFKVGIIHIMLFFLFSAFTFNILLRLHPHHPKHFLQRFLIADSTLSAMRMNEHPKHIVFRATASVNTVALAFPAFGVTYLWSQLLFVAIFLISIGVPFFPGLCDQENLSYTWKKYLKHFGLVPNSKDALKVVV